MNETDLEDAFYWMRRANFLYSILMTETDFAEDQVEKRWNEQLKEWEAEEEKIRKEKMKNVIEFPEGRE
jgi:hypothetical protein